MKYRSRSLLFGILLVMVGLGGYALGYMQSDTFNTNENAVIDENDQSVLRNIKQLTNKINENYLNEVSEDDLETGIYKGLFSSLEDPYSQYLSEDEFKSFMEDSSGEFGGIGIQVSQNPNGYIEVIAPIKGTPGDKAGILPGDFITHINGDEYFADDLDNAVKVMRGNPGDDVTVTILRGSGSNQEIFDLTITREIINVQSVYSELIDGTVGYIHLTSFQEKSDTDLVDAVDDLKSKGAKSLVLDLRNNPGGLLDVAMNIADYLMDEGTVISVRYKDESKNEELTTKNGKEDIPLVVLINKGSASASEVLSGALQDNQRAKIVGETSFGKGVIQQVFPYINEGRREGYKITVAEFYTPYGHQIHGKGITPDEVVELPEDVTLIGVENLEKDTQLQKAVEIIKQ